MYLCDTRARHRILVELSKHTIGTAQRLSKVGFKNTLNFRERDLWCIIKQARELGLDGFGQEGGVGTDGLA